MNDRKITSPVSFFQHQRFGLEKMSATVNISSEGEWRGILGKSAITVADCKSIHASHERIKSESREREREGATALT